MTSKAATKRSLQNRSYYCYIICKMYFLITTFEGLILSYGPRKNKNENQVIVRSKQPIKIEKPFQSLLTFCHSAGEKNILQSVLLSFFSVFIFSMPSKVILIVIEFMFLGISIFWALLRLILALA